MRPRDTTAESYEAQLAVYRRLGAPQRADLAARMSAATRELTRAGIRSRHPDYDEQKIELALRRLLYGEDLFRRAWPGEPLLAP
jgi:hypothetical protein